MDSQRLNAVDKNEMKVLITAIASLTLLEALTLCVLRIDGTIMLAVGAIVGGIATSIIKKIRKQ